MQYFHKTLDVQQHAEQIQPADDRRAIPVVVLGILVAVVPFLLVPFPGDGGPITFAVRLMQGIAVVVGVGVMVAGYHSYRTGDLRPSVAAASSILGLTLFGVVGGIVETTGGPFVPVGVWLLSAILVVGLSVIGAYRRKVTSSS